MYSVTAANKGEANARNHVRSSNNVSVHLVARPTVFAGVAMMDFSYLVFIAIVCTKFFVFIAYPIHDRKAK